mgnify:CR=1 FL=1
MPGAIDGHDSGAPPGVARSRHGRHELTSASGPMTGRPIIFERSAGAADARTPGTPTSAMTRDAACRDRSPGFDMNTVVSIALSSSRHPRPRALTTGLAACALVLATAVFAAPPSPIQTESTPGVGVWNSLPPPLGRFLTSAVFDPASSRMVVFGGFWYDGPSGGAGLLHDVAILSLSPPAKWIRPTISRAAPSPRSDHSAVLDPARNRMIAFGGQDDVGSLNDVWSLSLSGPMEWTRLTPSGAAPSARRLHSAIHDPVRDRMIVFGGGTNDLWSLSLSGTTSWSPIVAAGTPPNARSGHVAIYDPARDRMIVFAGKATSGGANLNDVWELSLSGTPTWTQLTPAGTPPRPWDRPPRGMRTRRSRTRSATACWCSEAEPVRLGSSFSGTPTWSTLAASGTLPPASVLHNTVYDPIHDQMILFGGMNPSFFDPARRDAWTLSLSGTPTWSKLDLGTVPAGRNGAAMVYDSARGRLLICGGETSNGLSTSYFNETWQYDLSGDAHWNLLTSGIPAHDMVGIYDPVRDRMVLFGGWQYIRQYPLEGHYNDVNVLSLAGTPTWTHLTPRGHRRPCMRVTAASTIRSGIVCWSSVATTPPCGRFH